MVRHGDMSQKKAGKFLQRKHQKAIIRSAVNLQA